MSNLSEAYRDYPLLTQDIIPLDFHAVQTVPESHQWPQSDVDDDTTRLPEIGGIVPVIDLTDPNAEQLIGHATENWGIFQVTNHGIDSSMLEKVEWEARRLFSLPTRQKLKALRSAGGATGYGAARISPFFSKFMWHEGFTIMGSSCVDHAKQLWPRDYNPFCDIMAEYEKKMKALAYQILLIILKSLDINISEQEDINIWAASTYESEGALQLNSYPCCPNPSRAIGLAPHTDSLLLTIVHQCQIGGLQIFRDGGSWIDVAPVAGALVVNVGDLLHIFANAKFPSVYHRVVVKQDMHRISVAYFYGPRIDSQVEPLTKLQPPRYRSLSVKEYISIKAKHLDQALSFIQINH